MSRGGLDNVCFRSEVKLLSPGTSEDVIICSGTAQAARLNLN